MCKIERGEQVKKERKGSEKKGQSLNIELILHL
jgi:hypothetical protein